MSPTSRERASVAVLLAAIGLSLLVSCENAAPEPEMPWVASSSSMSTAGQSSGAVANAAGAGTSAGAASAASQAGGGARVSDLDMRPSGQTAASGGNAGNGARGGDEADGGIPKGDAAMDDAALGMAGAGGAPAGAAGTSGQSSAMDSPAVEPPCLKKSSELVVVGDSYLNWITHNFPDDFTQAFGEHRMYAVGGASMGSGGISGFIPDQLTTAISDDPDITAVVMTGGGNDILIADTVMYPDSDSCKDRTDADQVQVCRDVITHAMDVAAQLMVTAADAGIKDTVYIYYPQIPGGGFGGMNPNVILAYALPLARDLCAQAEANTDGRLRCHFLDLQPVFEGHPDWFADDGIHENELGSAAMAKAVTQLLKDKCIAQPEASGCCAP